MHGAACPVHTRVQLDRGALAARARDGAPCTVPRVLRSRGAAGPSVPLSFSAAAIRPRKVTELQEGQDPPGTPPAVRAPSPPAGSRAAPACPRHPGTQTHARTPAGRIRPQECGAEEPGQGSAPSAPWGKPGLGALAAAPGPDPAQGLKIRGLTQNHAGVPVPMGVHWGQTDRGSPWEAPLLAAPMQIPARAQLPLTRIPVTTSGPAAPASGSVVALASGSVVAPASGSVVAPAPSSLVAQLPTCTFWQRLPNRPPAQRPWGSWGTPLPPRSNQRRAWQPPRAPRAPLPCRSLPGGVGAARNAPAAPGGPFVRRSQRSSARKEEFLQRSNAFANWTPTSKQTRLPARGRELRGGEDPISSFVPGLLFFAGGEEAGERQGKGHKSQADRRERRNGAGCRWG